MNSGAVERSQAASAEYNPLYDCPQPFCNQNSSASKTRMWCLARAKRIEGLMGRILVEGDLE